MSAITMRHGVRLLRPLLTLSKSRLVATLETQPQAWLEDPSNDSTHYTRNLIRQKLSRTADYPGMAKRAGELAAACGALRGAMERRLCGQMVRAVDLFPSGYGTISMPAFSAMPQELAVSALAATIMAINGQPHPPRTETLHRFYRQCSAQSFNRGTIGGCLVTHQPRYQRLLLCREPQAIAAGKALPPGKTVTWDNRFHITLQHTQPLWVHAVGRDGARLLRADETNHPIHVDNAVLPTLPALWSTKTAGHLEELVAVPHIGYRNNRFRHITCSIRFKPAKTLAGPCFFSMNSRISPIAQE